MAKKEKEVTTEHYLNVPTVDVDVDAAERLQEVNPDDERRVPVIPVEEENEDIDQRIARYEAELEKTEKKTPKEIALRAGLEALRWVKTL